MTKKDKLIEIVCKINGITFEDYNSGRQKRYMAWSRFILFHYFRQFNGKHNLKMFDLDEIGYMFGGKGGKGHSAVIYGSNQILSAYKYDDKLMTDLYDECKKQLDSFIPDKVTKEWFNQLHEFYIYSKYSTQFYI